MKHKKQKSLVLVLATIFFMISTAFTFNAMSEPEDCELCDAANKCVTATKGQVGMTTCDDKTPECTMSGYYCWKDPT